MPALRVLHVIPSLSPRDGGPSRAALIMERALSRAGVAVTTLTTDHDLARFGRPPMPGGGMDVRRIYARKWLAPYKVAPGLVPRLIEAVPEHDVVHIHALFSFSSTIAAWAARRFCVPYILRPLGTLSGYGMRTRRRALKQLSLALVERRFIEGAAAVHFTSQAELDEAGSLGLPMRGVVIPLGIDPDDGATIAPLQHEALKGRRVILFLSRLDPKKNLEALINAVAASPRLRHACALIVAGTGNAGYVASLKARAQTAGLTDQIVWLGHIDGAEKRAALAAADAFVLPSFSENFGIAALEALRAGVPCVLSAGVAIARDVEEAGAGLAVSPEPASIAHALECILGGDPSVAHRMALRAPDVVEQRFSARAMARQLVALYQYVRGGANRCEIQRAS
jgi:glycosyltransferase involved in cell wall biosynthesis